MASLRSQAAHVSNAGHFLQAVKRLIQACQSKDATLKEIPGGYHELIMGPEKEQVIPMIIDWILAHAGTNAAKM